MKIRGRRADVKEVVTCFRNVGNPATSNVFVASTVDIVADAKRDGANK